MTGNVLYLGDGSLNGAASYLSGVMTYKLSLIISPPKRSFVMIGFRVIIRC